MGTLLVTRRMSPELRARVEASVRGRRVAPGARLRARSISALRLLAFLSISGAIAVFAVAKQRSDERFELARASLLSRVRREAAALSARDRAIIARVTPWLERAAGSDFRDSFAPELAESGALAVVLARPTVYLRAPLAGVAGPASLAEAAAQSYRDAFVLCLFDPPATRSEKSLLSRARSAHAGGARARAASEVARLADAMAGLPFLSREWESSLLAAGNARALDVLERRFERAPIAEAKRAAKAELLLFALDEAGDANAPIELDGERPHYIRAGLVDLEHGRSLFTLRRHVDPGWLSPAARAEYASGVDGCSLALEVHALVKGSAAAGSQK